MPGRLEPLPESDIDNAISHSYSSSSFDAGECSVSSGIRSQVASDRSKADNNAAVDTTVEELKYSFLGESVVLVAIADLNTTPLEGFASSSGGRDGEPSGQTKIGTAGDNLSAGQTKRGEQARGAGSEWNGRWWALAESIMSGSVVEGAKVREIWLV